MPAISANEAAEKLAQAVEQASANQLPEIYFELFPEMRPSEKAGPPEKPVASQLAKHIRGGLEPEEIVDLWNVVFPSDKNVHYDEEECLVRYNEKKPWHIEY
jgi:hypothetical protein